MKNIIIYSVSSWVLLGVIFSLFWHFNQNPELKLYNLLIQYLYLGIAFTSIIISVNTFYFSRKIQKDMIIPELQGDKNRDRHPFSYTINILLLDKINRKGMPDQ